MKNTHGKKNLPESSGVSPQTEFMSGVGQNLLRTLIDNLPDYIFVKDTQSRFVLNNMAHINVLGATWPEEVIGKTDFDFFPPDLANQYYADEQELIRTGQPLINREEITVTPQGSRQWLLTSKTPLRDNEGKIIGLVGISRDITERKQTEETLQASEAHNRALIAAIPDAILHLDSKGVFRDATLPPEFVSRLPATALVGKNLEAVLPSEAAQQAQVAIRQAIATGQIQTFEYKIPLADEIRSRETRVVALGPDEVLAIVRDVTEGKRVEAALRESEQRYRQLFEGIGDAVVVYSSLGQFLDCNEVACHLLGYSREEFLRLNAADVIQPEFHRAMLDKQQKLWAGHPTVLEAAHRRRDGTIIPVEVNTHRVSYQGQAAILAVVRDITERKRTEKALWDSQRFIQRIADTAPLIIYLYDLVEHSSLYINNQVFIMLGYTPLEIQIMGSKILESLIHPADAQSVIEHYTQVCTDITGNTFECEFRARHTNGNWRWLRSRDVVFNRTSEGLPQQILGTAEDITEHKQMEEALRESETRAKRMQAQLVDAIESLTEAFALYDSEDRLVLCNSKYREYYDLGDDILVPGIYFEDHIRVSARRGQVLEAVNHEEEWVQERIQQHQNPQGTYLQQLSNGRWLQISERRTQDGGIVGVRTDITELKQAEEEKARLIEAISRQREQLHALTGQLAEAQEIERRHLARELHDRVGQNLTALGLNLNLIRGQLSGETSTVASIQARLDDSMALVEQTTESIRDVMADLRPPVLDDYGLLAALRWYGSRVANRAGFTLTVQGDESWPRLAAPVENALFRIAQEALINAAKHASASQVTMKLELDDEVIRLFMTDNGCGFDLSHLTNPGERPHWGILTMTERAEAVGGWFRIESAPHQGTQVIVEVSR